MVQEAVANFGMAQQWKLGKTFSLFQEDYALAHFVGENR